MAKAKEVYVEYNEGESKKQNKFVKFFKYVFTYNNKPKKRIWELDILRGILMIFVTLCHCCQFGNQLCIFDFVTPFGIKVHDFINTYSGSAFAVGIQPFGLWLFCWLSGVNCSFSRSKVRRVLKMVFFCGLFMGGYYALHLLVPSFIVGDLIFNIIAVITICVTIWWLLDLVKCPDWIRIGIAIIAICLGLTYYYMDYVRGGAWVENDFLALMVYNGHAHDISRQDFQPLFPHLGWFILGGVMGKKIYKEKKTLTKHEEPYKVFRPLAYIGKHSLVVYMIGTVVVLGLVWAIKDIVHLFL